MMLTIKPTSDNSYPTIARRHVVEEESDDEGGHDNKNSDNYLTQEEKEAILDDMYGRRRRQQQQQQQQQQRRRRTNAGERSSNSDENDGTNNNNNNNNNEGQNHQQRQQQQADDGDGGGDDDDNNEDDEAELMYEFHSALESIPYSQKTELEIAWVLCPHLVDTESNPLWFIQWSKKKNSNGVGTAGNNNNNNNNNDDDDENIIEKNIATMAALRLIEYWETRVEVFGEVDAFKPLTVNGALKDHAREMLKYYLHVRILPDDDHNRTVFCIDANATGLNPKDHRPEDINMAEKLLWFHLHLAIQKETCRENGIVVLHIDTSSTWGRHMLSRKMIQLRVKIMNSCFPVRIVCRHYISSSIRLNLTIPVWKTFVPSREDWQRLIVYNIMGKSTKNTLDKLKEFGLHSTNLPKSIGGTYDEKPIWLEECERIVKRKESRRKRKRQQ